MRIQNLNNTQNNPGVSVTPLSDTDTKIVALRNKISKQLNTIDCNEKTIEDLKRQLQEAGIRPNGAIPIHGGVLVSQKPGELGKLETKSFMLAKKIKSQEYFINSMRRQLDNS